MMKYAVVVEKATGNYSAYVPDLPGCGDEDTARAETSPDASVATPGGSRRPKSYNVQLPAVVGNRYKLIDVRGGGGMAKVYRGFDQTLERDVAVKLINPDLRSDP